MKRYIAALLISAFSIGTAVAHSGGTNSQGCHNDHKNGTYHCHWNWNLIMIEAIDSWIDNTLTKFYKDRNSCEILHPHYKGYYSKEFLAQSYFVIIDEIPKPDFPELYEAGLGGFLSMDLEGITYKDTYFIKTDMVSKLDLHFHELVHVAQLQQLGSIGFIKRYINELKQFEYREAPLEKMAYFLQEEHYLQDKKLDVLHYVKNHL